MDVSKISGGLIADVLGRFGVPNGTAQAIYESVIERRKQQALNILLKEIRQGDFSGVDDDETVSVIARYLRDAAEGTARNNMKLLAQTIHGMSQKQVLVASSFNRYATVIASLSEVEIRLIGFMVRMKFYDYLKHEKEFDAAFPKTDLYQVFQGLMRTGLITFNQGIEAHFQPEHGDDRGTYEASVESEAWTNYETTPLFSEIVEYTRFYDLEDLQ
jgi:hypothetical protein